MDAGKPHVFLAAYGGGHISMILPVSKQLRDRGWKVTLLALTTAAVKAEQVGEPYIRYLDLMHLAAPNSWDVAHQLNLSLEDNSLVSKDETLAYHGVNFAELIETYGPDAAWQQWKGGSRQSFLPVNFMKRVLSEFRPDVVVATNSPRTERATIMAAKALGIPALCAVDLFALQEVSWIASPAFADRVTVLNESVRQMMLSHGRDPEQIVVTGNPAFDIINLPSTVSAGRRMRHERKWDDDRLTILWASNAEPSQHPFTGMKGDPQLPRHIEEKLRELVCEDQRFRLVIRYHPNENIVFEPAENVELSPTAESLHALLHAVDIIIVSSSTVGLEAWLAQRPVFSVEGSIFTADAPFAKMGIARGVPNSEALVKILKDMAGKQLAFPISGQVPSSGASAAATNAVVIEIEKLLN